MTVMKMIRSTRAILSVAIPATMLIASCGNDPVVAEDDIFDAKPQSAEEVKKEKERMEKTKSIFYNIPSPMETASLLRKAGAEYDKEILNNISNVDKYTASSKQALNLGVYGADLSYAGVFDRTSESLIYTSCTRKLADKLGVTMAFSEEVMDRLNANQHDRDSLLNIVSETYWSMDGYLKENGREDISAMIIAGGWVEGLYIATQVAKIADSPDLRSRIAEQKLSLQDLSSLVSSYDEKDSLEPLKADLKRINSLFQSIGTGTASSNVSQSDGVTVIGGGGTAATITDDQLAEITATVAEIRARYTN